MVSFPIAEAFDTPLSNLLEIVCCFSDDVYVITGSVKDVKVKMERKGIKTYNVLLRETNNLLARILRYMHLQIQVSLLLAKLSKNVDIVLFFMQSGAFLPALTAKLFRKKILLVLPSSIAQMAKCRDDFFDKMLICLQSVSYELADRIIIYSPNLITEWNLGKYSHKILVTHRHFVDFSRFTMRNEISKRPKLVGYVGRLSKEKGILNFLRAIPMIVTKNDLIEFLIGGDGPLRNEIEEHVDQRSLNNKVNLIGWISHEKLPFYLNELKLLVLPSFTEGLPNILLEAMACGTPVLATPVGAIPDVVVEEKTGFLLKSTKPERITERVLELLGNSILLERVSKEAYKFVRKEFCFEKTLELWKNVLRELNIHTKECHL